MSVVKFKIHHGEMNFGGVYCTSLPPKCLLGAMGRVIVTAQCNEKPGKTTQLVSVLWEIPEPALRDFCQAAENTLRTKDSE